MKNYIVKYNTGRKDDTFRGANMISRGGIVVFTFPLTGGEQRRRESEIAEIFESEFKRPATYNPNIFGLGSLR